MSKALDWLWNLFHKPQPPPQAVKTVQLPSSSPVVAAPSPPVAPVPPIAPQNVRQQPVPGGQVMSENLKAMKAWVGVNEYLIQWGLQRSKPSSPPMSPQTEYALRRIGGLANFRATPVNVWIQAYNEAPIVDADQNNSATDHLPDGVIAMNQRAIEK